MSDRPRVILTGVERTRYPQGRARLLRLSDPRPVITKVPDSPSEFCLFAREITQIGPDMGFANEHLKKLSEILGLAPVAYYNPGNHWNLVVGASQTEQGPLIQAYDPLKGLTQPAPIRGNIYYFFDNSVFYKGSVNALVEDNYQIPTQPLDQLGPIQEDDKNCGH